MTNKKKPQNKLAAIKAHQLKKDSNCYAKKEAVKKRIPQPAGSNKIKKENLFKRMWKSIFK